MIQTVGRSMRSRVHDMIRTPRVPKAPAHELPMRNNRLYGLILLIPLMGGCDYIRGVVHDLRPPLLTPEGERLDKGPVTEPRVYPAKAAVGEPLDIEVIRIGNGIVLENRTVQSYGDVQLWLNQEYGATLDSIPIGRRDAVAMRSFVNRHRERYPVARFLEPDADQPLVSAELLIDGTRRPLTVRLTDDWRRP
jgi:hypothetical protein